MEVDIPIVSVIITNTVFANNTAVAVSDSLYGDGGIVRQPPAPATDGGSGDGDGGQDYSSGGGSSGTMDLRVPVESCGNGGGGAVCVRGATGAPVSHP